MEAVGLILAIIFIVWAASTLKRMGDFETRRYKRFMMAHRDKSNAELDHFQKTGEFKLLDIEPFLERVGYHEMKP